MRRYSLPGRMSIQVNYLHAGPQSGPEVCGVCFGPVDPRFSCCYQCRKAKSRAGEDLADLVVPITYRGKDGQHARDLWMYKQDFQGAEAAKKNLASLFLDFCRRHIACVKRAAGIETFSHVAFVPSTKTIGRRHPLHELLAPIVRTLQRVDLQVNPEIDPSSRDFHPYWFELREIPAPRHPTDVLLIDDTWVTGARAQSAAHRLKRSGARKVVTVVLARQIDPAYSPARPLLDRITMSRFNAASCAVHMPEEEHTEG